MALQSNRQFQFAGVDSRSNPLALPPGSCLRCRNWIITPDRHLQLRWGYTNIPMFDGGVISYTAPTPIVGETLEVIYPASASGSYSNSINAYDGNESTPSSAVALDYPSPAPSVPASSAGPFTETWSFGVRTGDTPTSIILKIRSQAAKTIGSYRTWTIGPHGEVNMGDLITGSGTVTNKISYTLNGGSTWTTVYNAENRDNQYDEITLTTGQDLSQVKVKADCSVDGTAISSTHKIFEIRIEVQV